MKKFQRQSNDHYRIFDVVHRIFDSTLSGPAKTRQAQGLATSAENGDSRPTNPPAQLDACSPPTYDFAIYSIDLIEYSIALGGRGNFFHDGAAGTDRRQPGRRVETAVDPQILQAINVIESLKARYFRTLDTRDVSAFGTVLADDTDVDTTMAFAMAGG
ncbi:hypothetical protein [Nocardia sp. CA-120079]|uniref:hypothetical protein n=1 Tax=Nocardia sp. CA-120079 TaxID=3239974 RepID=UPI003D96B364